MSVDPVKLTVKLVKCASITPIEAGAISLLDKELSNAGFICTRVDQGDVSNLFARWGKGKTFGFNGHTDVVPLGDKTAWTVDPFGGEIKDGYLYGRGSTDMKSGVAAFVAAAIDFVKNTPPSGSIVLAITGDEEGSAKDGTLALLDWMQKQNERIDHCLVGEPTCLENIGDMMKIGRRGSMTAYFTATGIQGHSAYPHRANNPIPAMAQLIGQLSSHSLDKGTQHFDPSTLTITTIDTGNTANNVIPAQCKATVNIRFNDTHHSDTLTIWMKDITDNISHETGIKFNTKIQVSGQSFLTSPSAFSKIIATAVKKNTGLDPEFSTSGGTSDARFIKDHCPVVELGLVGKTMHEVDERVKISDIRKLKEIYTSILEGYFA